MSSKSPSKSGDHEISHDATVGFGTFPAADERTFKWEGAATPLSLLIKAGASSGKILVSLFMLAYMLLSLRVTSNGLERVRGANPTLMPCNPTQVSNVQVVLCEYTKAYLRGFPLLAMSVTLAVAMRLMLQTRIYYGMLKCGGLLDFENVQGFKDPVLLLLVISLFHGVAHFALMITDGQGHGMEEASQMLQKFAVPCIVFLAFFYGSYDLESTLLPLNKYFEEDPEYCQRALATIQHMEEGVVSSYVASHDVIAQALTYNPSVPEPSITMVYRLMIQDYAGAKKSSPDSQEGILQLSFFQTFWPGSVLLENRLTDDASKTFRTMFRAFLCVCFPVQTLIFAAFVYQALWKDLYQDVYLEGQVHDLAGCVVLIGHTVAVAWIIASTFGPVKMALGHQHKGQAKID